jgi:hypothetical protein
VRTLACETAARLRPLVGPLVALLVVLAVTGRADAQIPAGNVYATSEGKQSTGRAFLTCSVEGDCVDVGIPQLTPSLPVHGGGVVQVRTTLEAEAVFVELYRRTQDAYAPESLAPAVRETDGDWRIELPKRLRRAAILAFDFQLPSGETASAEVPLTVLPGPAPTAETTTGVAAEAASGPAEPDSGDLGWGELGAVLAAVAVLTAAVVGAIALRRRGHRREAEPTA